MKFISAAQLWNRWNCCTFDPQRNWAGYELNPICPAVVCPFVHLAFCLLHTNAFPRRADWPKGTATAYVSTPCFFDTTVRNSRKWHVQIYASSLQGGGHSPPPPFFLLLLIFLPFGITFFTLSTPKTLIILEDKLCILCFEVTSSAIIDF